LSVCQNDEPYNKSGFPLWGYHIHITVLQKKYFCL